ncbi:MAG: KH domain-containing protein [Candidatus Aenigmatarchaeota archaeon]
MVAKVRNDVIARLIGKAGKNIEQLEKKLGIHISVEPREKTLKREIPWEHEESGAFISLFVHPRYTGKQVDIYEGEEFVFSPYVGRKGLIKVKKKTELGRALLRAIAGKQLKILT